MPSRPLHDRHALDGCPGYVRGWCCKAGERSLARGYRDVGYLLAPRLRRFRPSGVSAPEWSTHVGRLRGLLLRGEDLAAVRWLTGAYPRLMALIPDTRRAEVVAGLRERVSG